ncbi:MAG TPA: rod shape-determining protein [Symbiobacteriaceae bacterium]|nr:rod shape-determining protein [Symbiobacteriaceae bacterium]
MERLGIDLGSYSARTITLQGQHLAEPAFVAVPKAGRRPAAAGRPALGLAEAEPGRYTLVSPLRDSVLVDDWALEALLAHLIKQSRLHRWGRVHLILTLPTGAPPLTREVMLETALDAGAALVDLVDESLAAALGAGLPIEEPPASLLLDLGASATRVTLFANGQILLAERLTIGGRAIDREIRDRLEVERGLFISLSEAEAAKRSLGQALAGGTGSVAVQGRSTISGRPLADSITAAWLFETVDLYLKAVEGLLLRVLSRAEPDWLQDLGHQGLLLTGGGANLAGLAERLADHCGFPCRVAPEPQSAVTRGVQRLLTEL